LVSSQENKYSSDITGIFWAIGIVIVCILLLLSYLWSQYSQVIKDLALNAAYYLRFAQIPFSFLFSDSYAGAINNLPNLHANLIGTPYDDDMVIPFTLIALRSVAIIFAFIAIPRAIYLIRNNDELSYTRHLTLRQLISIMREKYPRIKPTTARWLLDEDSRFGSLGSQMNPIELIIHRGIIDICNPDTITDPVRREVVRNKLHNLEIAGLKPPPHYLKNIGPLSVHEYAGLTFPTCNLNPFDKDIFQLLQNIDLYHGLLTVDQCKIKAYFQSTLGPRCQYSGHYIDINYLPQIERSLWIIFTACIAQRSDYRETINTLLDLFSASFVEGPFGSNDHSINLEGVDELYESAIQESSVRIELARIAKTHGYYYTAFMELYRSAKHHFGTITTQDFRWLRITNRILFYTLNQVGLERARYEAAAIKSHYLAEKARNNNRGGRIGRPQVDSAVLNTIHALDAEEWTAEPLTFQDEDPESQTFMKACWIKDKVSDEN
jgi:hypothetical protein